MFESGIVILILITVIDRAGIPIPFITGMYLLKDKQELLFPFFVLSSVAGIIGDVVMYLGGIYFAGKKEANYLIQQAGIKNKIISKSKFISDNPILWIYASKAFNFINQLIPIALGINKYSKVKFLINAIISNFLWFGLFYVLSDTWLKFLAEKGKTIGFLTGIIGLIVIYLGLKYYEKRGRGKANQY